MSIRLEGYCSICGCVVYIKNHKQKWNCEHRGPANISTYNPNLKYDDEDYYQEDQARKSIFL